MNVSLRRNATILFFMSVVLFCWVLPNSVRDADAWWRFPLAFLVTAPFVYAWYRLYSLWRDEEDRLLKDAIPDRVAIARCTTFSEASLIQQELQHAGFDAEPVLQAAHAQVAGADRYYDVVIPGSQHDEAREYMKAAGMQRVMTV